MLLDKDENIENTKSVRETKGEDEEYGRPNQQCQSQQKVFAAETKTKDKVKQNQGEKTSMAGEDKKKHKYQQNK